ncbi:MAG: 4Fe-4S binding protein [Candidatus Obscuribacterales bacterium]|nr:4Fe-4S binding protein [Candidatus Obscuribacterales bacterium]
MCIQCSACEMACPLKAIQAICGRYCIDASICNECKKCVEECPTGAADCYIEVHRTYSVDEQAAWSILPKE